MIPFPENPEHADNLSTIALLKEQGFTGPDASLRESLFCYDLAYRTLPSGELLVIYRIRGEEEESRFDRTTFKADLVTTKEWDWADWDAVRDCVGEGTHYPESAPLTTVIQDLVSFYGTEEVFGTSYWEGFSIA